MQIIYNNILTEEPYEYQHTDHHHFQQHTLQPGASWCSRGRRRPNFVERSANVGNSKLTILLNPLPAPAGRGFFFA
jgi:hypothetical protein